MARSLNNKLSSTANSYANLKSSMEDLQIKNKDIRNSQFESSNEGIADVPAKAKIPLQNLKKRIDSLKHFLPVSLPKEDSRAVTQINFKIEPYQKTRTTIIMSGGVGKILTDWTEHSGDFINISHTGLPFYIEKGKVLSHISLTDYHSNLVAQIDGDKFIDVGNAKIFQIPNEVLEITDTDDNVIFGLYKVDEANVIFQGYYVTRNNIIVIGLAKRKILPINSSLEDIKVAIKDCGLARVFLKEYKENKSLKDF